MNQNPSREGAEGNKQEFGGSEAALGTVFLRPPRTMVIPMITDKSDRQFWFKLAFVNASSPLIESSG